MLRLFTLTVVAWVLLTPAPAYPQIHWFKYEGNPVLNAGPPGAWDNSAARIDRVIRTDSGYQMWYTGYKDGVDPGPNIFPHIGTATSKDGLVWTKEVSNPVMRPGPSGWDGEGAFRPYVLMDGSIYKMWYTGVGCCPTFSIGYAFSQDGVEWTKQESGKPALATGTGWESGGVEHPSVIGPDSNRVFTMWYQGIPGFGIGYASSSGDSTWTKHSANPVFTSSGWVFYPRVLSSGQGFDLWYGLGQPTSVGYATSVDGLFSNPSAVEAVLEHGIQGEWDANGILPGDIHLDGGMYRMWYSGNDRSRWRSGYAVSPKGMDLFVSRREGPLDRNKDTVFVRVHVASPNTLVFSLEVESPDGTPVDTLVLFDDGAHGDSLAGDGVFANAWVPGDRSSYTLDLKLRLQDSLAFEMNNIAAFYPVVPVVAEAVTLPVKFSLEQNYPNPFNPSTVINYTIGGNRGGGGGGSDVSLVVYDVLGREVAVLVNERKQPGHYVVTLDGTTLPSGTYFYRLVAGEFVQVKKAVLMK